MLINLPEHLPAIAKWVTEHGGQPGDVIPFSVEYEQKVWGMREDPDAQAAFLKESKVPSRIGKIVTSGFARLGLQYYFTGKPPSAITFTKIREREGQGVNVLQPARKKSAVGLSRRERLLRKLRA
jgi:ribosome-binding ATPase YchF (GTP1/OBG family)